MKTILATLIIFFLFVSCNKEKSIPTTYVPLHLKQVVPYQNGQVVKFKHNYGGILQFTATVVSRISEKSDCDGCDRWREEYIEYKLNTGTGRPFIELSIDNRPVIFLTLWSPEDNYNKGSGYNIITVAGMPQINCTGGQSCLSSVNLNGKSFANVLEMTLGPVNGIPGNQLAKAYYSITQGIVGFTYVDGSTYSLEE